MKYIILGGNGFIGQNLCQFLVNNGHDVTVYDRKVHAMESELLHFEQADFFDDKKLREAVIDKDVIVHAISTVNPGNSNDTYLDGYKNDLIQTIKLCSWIKNANKKILFISSGGTVYGEHELMPLSESVLPKPINHYANIKLSIENALRIFHIQDNLSVGIARVSNPYGPGQDYTKGVGFIDAVLKRSLKGKPVEIWGDGNNIRDYIYIEDVCRFLYELSLYHGNEYLFNVSSGIGVSQNDIIEIVENLGIKVKVNYKQARSVDVRRIVLDNSKIKNICHIQELSIDIGIEKYYKYLLNTFANNPYKFRGDK